MGRYSTTNRSNEHSDKSRNELLKRSRVSSPIKSSTRRGRSRSRDICRDRSNISQRDKTTNITRDIKKDSKNELKDVKSSRGRESINYMTRTRSVKENSETKFSSNKNVSKSSSSSIHKTIDKKNLRNSSTIRKRENEVRTEEKKTDEISVEPAGASLDLKTLGKLSKEKLQADNFVKLPNIKNYSFFEKEKEQYYKNMYKMIVTARNEIKMRDEEIEDLKIRLNSKNAISCPSCSHKFNTSKNRFLPRYLKVLQSTNRIELQFNEMNHLKEWLILNNLDTDKNGIPVLIPKKIDTNFLTLSDVNSSLLIES